MMRARGALIVLLTMLVAVLVMAPAQALKRQPPVIDPGKPYSGTHAYTFADNTVRNVTVLKLRAKASPKQAVKATGYARCNGVRKAFSYQGSAPLIRPLPINGPKPATCTYHVKAQLTGTGTITLDILGR